MALPKLKWMATQSLQNGKPAGSRLLHYQIFTVREQENNPALFVMNSDINYNGPEVGLHGLTHRLRFGLQSADKDQNMPQQLMPVDYAFAPIREHFSIDNCYDAPNPKAASSFEDWENHLLSELHTAHLQLISLQHDRRKQRQIPPASTARIHTHCFPLKDWDY